MNGRWKWGMAAALAGATGMTVGAQAAEKKVPYWASISEGEARMRVGPDKDYPANWVYRRRDLPVKVVLIHGNWRKIEVSAGAQGWMHVRLLSDRPTAIVTGSVAPMRAAPKANAAAVFRAEPGVVGRVSDCGNGWCLFSVGGQRGFVRTSSLWGGGQ